MKINPKLDFLLIQSSPLETGQPNDNCWVVVHADIGPEGEKAPDGSAATDIFLFYVTTPKKLLEISKDKGYEFGYSLIIVEEYKEDLVRDAIKKLLSEIDGDTWEEVAKKINKYGRWEYDDYKE